MNGPDLRALVRDVAAESSAPDPAGIAAEVLTRLSDRQVREALTETLPNYVRLVVGARSSMFPINSPDAKRASVPNGPPRPGVNTTGRAQRVHDWAAELRAKRLYVGDAWKHAAECTADDLRTVGKQRGKLAADIAAEGARWVRVAEEMDAYGASTLADLPEPVLRDAWRVAS